MLEAVEVGLDQQQVGASLDGKEATTGNVDTVGVLEVADGGTNSSLKLVDGLVGLTFLVSRDGLLVGNNLHLELVLLDNTLNGAKVHPDVIGVEVLELLDGLELVDVLLGHLGDFKETDLALIVDDCTTLDIGLGFVGQFHDIFSLGVNHVLQDAGVNNSAQVVGVGQENILDAALQEFVEGAGVVQ